MLFQVPDEAISDFLFTLTKNSANQNALLFDLSPAILKTSTNPDRILHNSSTMD
jgi:hypothetical protein